MCGKNKYFASIVFTTFLFCDKNVFMTSYKFKCFICFSRKKINTKIPVAKSFWYCCQQSTIELKSSSECQSNYHHLRIKIIYDKEVKNLLKQCCKISVLILNSLLHLKQHDQIKFFPEKCVKRMQVTFYA